MKLTALLVFSAVAWAQTTRYPGAVDSDSSLFVVADNVQTTLNAAMGASDTAAVLANGAGFLPNMIATICDVTTNTGKCTSWEHMLVTAVNGNILTVARGFAGTTPAAHTSGRIISILIDAAHQKVLKDSVVAIETALGPNLSNIAAASGTALASGFSFAPYSCNSSSVCSPGGPSGMALAPGNNSLTLTPVPAGVNGADSGHALYISGGAGGPAEGCTITGGSAVGGQASGSLIINCASSHAGAWTIQSASGGLQEAICSFPASGGEAMVNSNITLQANVTACGKTSVEVAKLPGAAFSGSFTILGVPPITGSEQQMFSVGRLRADVTIPSNLASMTTVYDAARFSLGNYPAANEWGRNTDGVPQALVGAVNVTTSGLVSGVSGYAMSNGNAAVGLLGQCVMAMPGGGCWGANLLAVQNGIYSNLDGNEIDVGATSASQGPAPANITAEAAVTGGYQQATVDHIAWSAQLADLPDNHVFYPFMEAFQSRDGAALIYAQVGADHLIENTSRTYANMTATSWNDSVQNVIWCTDCVSGSNPCTAGGTGAYAQKSGGATAVFRCSITQLNSQPIRFDSYDTTRVQRVSQIITDGPGNIHLGAGTGTGTRLYFDSPIGTTHLALDPDGGIWQTGVTFANLASNFGNGKTIYCTDCKNSLDDAVTVGSVCVAGGHGALAVFQNGKWSCK